MCACYASTCIKKAELSNPVTQSEPLVFLFHLCAHVQEQIWKKDLAYRYQTHLLSEREERRDGQVIIIKQVRCVQVSHLIFDNPKCL